MLKSDFTENLFQSIDTIIAERIRQLPYDKTQIVEIIDNANAANGIYKISPDNQYIEIVYSDNPTYEIGDKVYLLQMAGTERRFIIGLYQKYTSGRINSNIFDLNNIQDNLKGFNYVNTLNPIPSSNRDNVIIIDNGVGLTYRDDMDTYFTLSLIKSLEKDKQYTLSFECNGISNIEQPLRFKVRSQSSNILLNEIILQEGKNIYSFIPKNTTTTNILFDDLNTTNERPTNINITLTNFQIEEGKNATGYSPSLIAIEKAIKQNENSLKGYQSNGNNGNWAVGIINNSYISSSKALTLQISTTEPYYNIYRSEPIYVQLPMALESFTLTGSCNSYGAYISNVNQLTGSGIIGASFRIYSPIQLTNISLTSFLQMSGLLKTALPITPYYNYNSNIGQEIINIAQTYIDSQDKNTFNQRYSYGKNFFYNNTNIIYLVNNNINYARVECDTYAGLVLRGIPYEKSPFKAGNIINTRLATNEEGDNNTFLYANNLPTGITLYDKIMEDTKNNLPQWAEEIRKKLQASTNNTIKNYLVRDARWASTHAWAFWTIPNVFFTDINSAQPGDVAFYKQPDANWFDSISHIAIVGERDVEGYLTIYEVTGNVESGGRILQHISLKHKTQLPAYFVRPYGWW